ncbi:MAG: NADH-quinone oxidoreductase subunit I [Chloroflexi bacterium]|nr:NADH-quinone oxidoreductase subunit I [Chloroflexota bacterium]
MYGTGLMKGMAVVLKTMLFKPPFTVQYPEQRVEPPRRFRGASFVWYEDRCTGCSTCAKACPQGNIEIVTSAGQYNQYFVEKFDIDHLRCMFCGLCVEACPYDALFMGGDFENASYSRAALVVGKKLLNAAAPTRIPSSYFHPELDHIDITSGRPVPEIRKAEQEKNQDIGWASR